MRAIMMMFDSLNRRMLSPYGCDWTHTPNFDRLAERSVVFDRAYVGSLPCMPARRELHTGRHNFLHRSWGPLEPFDFSMPEALKKHGVYTHLVTDHYHYWEDGGATYHNRYSSYEFFRGQEGDSWKGVVSAPAMPENLPRTARLYAREFFANLPYLQAQGGHYQEKTVAAALEFVRTNQKEQDWFLHIECFDPHEPWLCAEEFRALYGDALAGDAAPWPPYGSNIESPERVESLRLANAALVSMCDASLGKVLDLMDELGMWQDTMLIVNTDHGFLLGEHEEWGKSVQPLYEEVSHVPLFIWDPRRGRKGARCPALVRTIDLPATLLEFFGVERPETMQGAPLRDTITRDAPVCDTALFGIHGGQVNVTDGRYVYMRAPQDKSNSPLFNYTLMPTHMRHMFGLWEFDGVTMAGPFGFTQGCKVMKCPAKWGADPHSFGTLLFDIGDDPLQERPLQDAKTEERMVALLVAAMQQNDAPEDQYDRLGLLA